MNDDEHRESLRSHQITRAQYASHFTSIAGDPDGLLSEGGEDLPLPAQEFVPEQNLSEMVHFLASKAAKAAAPIASHITWPAAASSALLRSWPRLLKKPAMPRQEQLNSPNTYSLT